MPNATAHDDRPSSGMFRPIPLSSLRCDTVVDFDIYVKMKEGLHPVLFRSRDLPITDDVLRRLGDNRHECVLIQRSQEHEYGRYLEHHLETVLFDPQVPVVEKSNVLYTAAHTMVEDILSNPESSDLMRRSKDLVASTAKFLISEKTSFEHLVGLLSYDYYTYTHSVNVFVYSFSLAHRLGVADQATLLEFGHGTLLHDIGKSRIDPSIIRSKGKLTDDQWKQMRLHPVYGFDILSDHGMFGELALDVARHHHEKISGKGYPDGLGSSKLSPLVRISTVADIFDALTTRRSYKPALDTFSALRLMQSEMADDLDPEVFRAFVELMGSPKA